MVKTHKYIDYIATNTLNYYDNQLLSGEPREIPIEEIIEFDYGLILEYKDLSKNGTIHGLTVFENSVIPIYNKKKQQYEAYSVKAGTILIDNSLLNRNQERRCRFTMAHELSHWILHRELYVAEQRVACKTSNINDRKVEREADKLAASILMPREMFKKTYLQFKNKLSFQETVSQMSQMFNVSAIATEIRLFEIGAKREPVNKCMN